MKSLGEISQSELLAMTEKNIFAHKHEKGGGAHYV